MRPGLVFFSVAGLPVYVFGKNVKFGNTFLVGISSQRTYRSGGCKVFGFPNEILSDGTEHRNWFCIQGSEFVSQALEVFLEECNIKNIKASVYHSECNGSLERFHRCLKNMLKAVLHDNSGFNWENVLAWVLI